MKQNTPNKSAERWLFTATMIIACLVCGCSSKPHPVPTREAAVRTLKHNGTVTIRVGAETRVVRHMKDLPLKGFAVFAINLSDKKDFSDEDLNTFQHLATLRQLNLEGTSVSDKSRNTLRTLTNLESLNLNRTSITDKTTRALTSLNNMKELHLADTDVTGDSLSHLNKLFSLQALDLSRTHIAPNELIRLTGLYNLSTIRMIGSDNASFPQEAFRTLVPLCSFISENTE